MEALFTNGGIEKMNRVENYVRYAQSEERKLWNERTKELAKYSNIIKVFTIISLIAAILLTFYSMVTFTKENKAKREADKKAIAYRNQLEMRIDELAAVNLELIELRNIEKFAATGRISRTIAHEVRNPLTNINLATEQLRNEISGNEDANLLFDIQNSNLYLILLNEIDFEIYLLQFELYFYIFQ